MTAAGRAGRGNRELLRLLGEAQLPEPCRDHRHRRREDHVVALHELAEHAACGVDRVPCPGVVDPARGPPGSDRRPVDGLDLIAARGAAERRLSLRDLERRARARQEREALVDGRDVESRRRFLDRMPKGDA